MAAGAISRLLTRYPHDSDLHDDIPTYETGHLHDSNDRDGNIEVEPLTVFIRISPKIVPVQPPISQNVWRPRHTILLWRTRNSFKICPPWWLNTERPTAIVASKGVDPRRRLDYIRPPWRKRNVQHNAKVSLLASHDKRRLYLCQTAPILPKTCANTEVSTPPTVISGEGTPWVFRDGHTRVLPKHENQHRVHGDDDRPLVKVDMGDTNKKVDSDRHWSNIWKPLGNSLRCNGTVADGERTPVCGQILQSRMRRVGNVVDDENYLSPADKW